MRIVSFLHAYCHGTESEIIEKELSKARKSDLAFPVSEPAIKHLFTIKTYLCMRMEEAEYAFG